MLHTPSGSLNTDWCQWVPWEKFWWDERRRLRCASSTCSLPILQLVFLFLFFFSCCSLLQLPHMPRSTQQSILCPKSVACRCCSLNLRSLCKMKCSTRTATMHLVADTACYALQTHKITVIVVARALLPHFTPSSRPACLSRHQSGSSSGSGRRSLGIWAETGLFYFLPVTFCIPCKKWLNLMSLAEFEIYRK